MKESRSVKKMFAKIQSSQHYSHILLLVSFLGAFVLIRLLIHLQRASVIPEVGEAEVRHLLIGIVLVLGSAYMAIAYGYEEKVRRSAAVIFGIGGAFVIDEFALWSFLPSGYWMDEGRGTIDVIIVTIVLVALSILLSEINDRRASKIPLTEKKQTSKMGKRRIRKK